MRLAFVIFRFVYICDVKYSMNKFLCNELYNN